MKVVLALSLGSAAAFVAPVRTQRLIIENAAVDAKLEPWMSKAWIAALARRRRLHRTT